MERGTGYLRNYCPKALGLHGNQNIDLLTTCREVFGEPVQPAEVQKKGGF